MGIKADFQKGREALFFLLDFLAASQQMDDRHLFEEQVQSTKAFLSKFDAETTLLESGEIYALYKNDKGELIFNAEDFERVNKNAFEDYTWIGEDIDMLKDFKYDPLRFFFRKEEMVLEQYDWLFKLRQSWKEEFGLDSWRDILYYQFKSE